MRDFVSEHLQAHAGEVVKPRMHLADGSTISVQASSGHYCTPRSNGERNYSHVEVGYPADMEWFDEWAEKMHDEEHTCPECGHTERSDEYYTGVAGWVPVEVVNEYIRNRGGLA